MYEVITSNNIILNDLMKIAYVIFSDYENHKSKGVMKKIDGEIKAFRLLGNQVNLIYRHNNYMVIQNDHSKQDIHINCGISKYRGGMCKAIKKAIDNENYDMLYVRFPGCIDVMLYFLFKYAKSRIKYVILELPTYPIGNELKERIKRLWKNKDLVQLVYVSCAYGLHRLLSRRIFKYVSYILSFFEYDKIWGIPVINVDNGIDISSIPVHEEHNFNNCINIIMVAAYSLWHGLDRAVKGLANYYEQKNSKDPSIKLTIVGTGQALEDVIQEKYYSEVKEHIDLVGTKHGKELDDLFNQANLAISSLGMHRIGLTTGSTLKTKEYCARGIPFLYSYNEKLIGDDFPYALKISANDSPVDYFDVIAFYQKCIGSNCSEKMRAFSFQYDWKNQIGLFLNRLQS